jgi:hypothetical protein
MRRRAGPFLCLISLSIVLYLSYRIAFNAERIFLAKHLLLFSILALIFAICSAFVPKK